MVAAMFDFLEREGAQVLVEPIATWVAYLMYQAKAHAKAKWPVNRPHRDPEWYEAKKQFANYIGLRKKLWGIGAGERMWNFFYHRTINQMGGITHELVPQTELAEMAHPFYNQFARGGEGHLEVGKNVYYTVHKLCHMLERLFGEEVRAGIISSPLDISDAWKNSYSCSTNHKVWAAKFTARHPNLVALEISSFKCGHDAPIYGVIEGIIEQSGTPYFCFKDLDENKPSGSIRIRVETIDYFLRRYREEVIRKRKAVQDIEAQLAALEAELRSQQSGGGTPPEGEAWKETAHTMAAD